MEDIVDTSSFPSIPHNSMSKRKAVGLIETDGQRDIQYIKIDNMILRYGGYAAYFIRLQFWGCPTKRSIERHACSSSITKIDRDVFVRKIYALLSSEVNGSLRIRFRELTVYITWLDEQILIPIDNDYFCEEFTDKYMLYWRGLVSQGKYARNSWTNVRSMLSFFLKNLNRPGQANRLMSIKYSPGTTNSYQPFTDHELKSIGITLFKAYNAFVSNIEDNSTPSIHPFYDLKAIELQRDKLGWSTTGKGNQFSVAKVAFRNCFNQTDWRNHLTRVACLITFMLTGKNTNSLLRMKRKDVIFSQVKKGYYILNSEKGRAKYHQQSNSLGFSEHTKRFLERWLSVSSTISDGKDDDYLFPFIKKNGEISCFLDRGSPQDKINKLFNYIGLPHVNASRFRKTKLNVLLRVTEDIYLVSKSANNSINVVQSHYSNGIQSDHERNLTASMDAKFNFAKTNDIETSVQEAKHKFHDILSDYDYKKLRKVESNPNEALTPQGLRCQNNRQGSITKIKRILEKVGVEINDDEMRCTDFLECFDCGSYKLVAEVNDIWLMLSFADTLEEMRLYPTVNSIQSDKFNKLCNTISAILKKFKSISPVRYHQAEEKLSNSPHPLYSDIHSLNDLYGVFSWKG